jgi:hypothetical protein
MSDAPDPQEAERWHRWMAAHFFNRAWELLELERTPGQDRELLAAALASWLHWQRVGSPVNLAVAEWQVSRVHAVLGDAGRAEVHARAGLGIAQASALGPFYLGYAFESLARAAALAGDQEQRGRWLGLARAAAEQVPDQEERALLLADLETI